MAGLAVYVLHAGLPVSVGALDLVIGHGLWNALFFLAAASCLARGVLVEAERAAWLVMGAGLVVFGVAWVYYDVVLEGLATPPLPSPADGLWLVFYPLSYASLVLLLRARLGILAKELWLDGLIGALALAALAATFVLGPLISATGGPLSTVVIDMLYALLDLHQVGFLLGVLGVTAWRGGRIWWLMAGGFALALAADVVFAYEGPTGSFALGGVMDAGWPAMALALGYAAWQPAKPVTSMNPYGSVFLALPAAFTIGAIGLHVYGLFVPLNDLARLLATATLVAAAARTCGAYREMRRLDALAGVDPLTGLANHGQFHAAVGRALARASQEAGQFTVVAFDVDGFKGVNDLRGHAEGDRVLREVAGIIRGSVRDDDAAFRTGGDEFSLLLVDTPPADAVRVAERIACAVDALQEGIGISFGMGAYPADGETKETVLLRADVALYAAKAGIDTVAPSPDDLDPAARRRRGDRSAALSRGRRPSQPDEDRELERAQLRAYARDVRLSYVEGLRRTERLEKSYLATVMTLAAAVEAKDDTTARHIERVTELGLILARRILPGQVDDPQMRYGFLLHDIGKLAVPDGILTKPGKLTDEEWAVMRGHPEAGMRILSSVPFLDRALDVVHHHHERWDGTGYPDRLAGEDIPIWARIFSVVDTVDAITSDRPYRRGRPLSVALDELLKGAGTQFDPACVEAFAAIAGGSGLESWMASGRTGSPAQRDESLRAG